MSRTCIITIIKDEQLYLDEWIAYHLNIGIDKIFIYEDINSTSHLSITSKYKNVELRHVLDLFKTEQERSDEIIRRIELHKFQNDYFNLAYNEVKPYFDWCFIMDVDEYITVEKDLQSTLSLYADYDAVLLQWQNFNANGHYYMPNTPYSLVNTYTEKCGFSKIDLQTRNTKKICLNCRTYDYVFMMHWPFNLSKWTLSDFTKSYYNISYSNIYLSHYVCKSYEEYIYKLYMRGMCHPGHRQIDDFFVYNPNMRNKEIIEEINKKLVI